MGAAGHLGAGAGDAVSDRAGVRASGIPGIITTSGSRCRFAYLTEDLLQRGDHRSVHALESDIRGWVKAWNDNPRPFIWTKSAEDILERLGRLLHRINGAGH